jgi:hypothetical protein
MTAQSPNLWTTADRRNRALRPAAALDTGQA